MSDDFYIGVICALLVLNQAGQDTYIEEIVASVDVKRLVRVARKHGDMRSTGLSRLGYGKRGQP